jgi:GNAT superfamily N-acetyltransferase
MNGYTVRAIEIRELKNIFKHIRQDFAKGEYAPYTVLKHQLQKGLQDGLVLQKAGKDTAYAICAAGHENGYVLISLLAVYAEFRQKGFGSIFIEEIKEKYKDKNGIIVEVEKPEGATSPEEREIRLKRMRFYEKAGFYQVPNIDYSIWDVPMHLMIFPLRTPAEDINRNIGRIMYDIYLQLMSKHFIHKLKFTAL